MANIELGLLETERQLTSMIEASGKTVPKPGERANIVEHLDYIIQLLGTMVSSETFEAAKEKMANGYNAINDRIEIVNYLLSSGEISGDIDIESLTITENGEYVPGAGKAFGRVVVSTPIENPFDVRYNYKISDSTFKFSDLAYMASSLTDLKTVGISYMLIGNGPSISAYSSLSTVNMQDVCRIDTNFFNQCASLTEVSFPNCSNIGSFAFAGCSSLTSISFPACTSIENNAFGGCLNLTSVDFPVCTNIGDAAFGGCGNLASISFPACTSIGNNAFGACLNLTSADFPVCTSISNTAFAGCSSLTSISFPACISIGNYAFGGCSSLTSISFPACTSIEDEAFANCSNLTSVDFSDCTSIGNAAFSGCFNLTSVDFPACTSIGNRAFDRCYNLISIRLPGNSVCNLLGSSAFLSTPIGGYSTSAGRYGSIFVPASLVDQYKVAANWSNFADRITVYVEP